LPVLPGYTFYANRRGLLQNLHTFSSLSYTAVLLVLALILFHPLYLAAVLAAVLLAVWSAGGLKMWEGYLRFTLPLALLLVVINLLTNRTGETIFWRSPPLPLVGRLEFTLEALCYGAAMAGRLVTVTGVFCLYNLTVHPDRLLGLFAKLAWRSALTTSLATRLYPAMVSSLFSIREALQVRGVNFEEGSVIERAKKYSFVLRVLLFSSLEDSLQLAEAMQARAFGIGRRSSYCREEFRPRDWLVLGGCALSLATTLAGLYFHWGSFSYYPHLSSFSLSGPEATQLAFVLTGILLPVALCWGWQKWKFLGSKI